MLAALSLAGIFVVYLIDSIGGDDQPASAQVAGATTPTSPTNPGGITPTGPSTPGTPAPGSTTPGGGAGGGGGAANSQGAAGGAARANRIPDNQQYETFTTKSADWAISYPTGWEASGTSKNKTWTHRLDFLHVITSKGTKPTVERIRAGLDKQKGVKVVNPPKEVTVAGKPAIKTTMLQKRKRKGLGDATIFIDQYRMESNGRTVAIDVACPYGVYKDNGDDFTRMVNSFRWL